MSKSYPTGQKRSTHVNSLDEAHKIANSRIDSVQQTDWDVYKVGYEITIFKTRRTRNLHMPVGAKDAYEARQEAIRILEQDYKSKGTVKITSVKKVT